MRASSLVSLIYSFAVVSVYALFLPQPNTFIPSNFTITDGNSTVPVDTAVDPPECWPFVPRRSTGPITNLEDCNNVFRTIIGDGPPAAAITQQWGKQNVSRPIRYILR